VKGLLAFIAAFVLLVPGIPALAQEPQRATREVVIALYELLLCRRPENEAIIAGSIGKPIADVAKAIQNSPEAAAVRTRHGTYPSGDPRCPLAGTPQPTPPPSPNVIRVYLDLDDTIQLSPGEDPTAWWHIATRGLGRLELVQRDADIVLSVNDNPRTGFGGWYTRTPHAVVYARECARQYGDNWYCAFISTDYFRLAVLHELGHHWCCYGLPGVDGSGSHWKCVTHNEIMCGEVPGGPTPPYPHVFSDRELRAMGMLR
jgi:hypothetical protein